MAGYPALHFQDNEKALNILKDTGLDKEILKLKDFDYKDPSQLVQAQEHLNQLLPKLNEAFKDYEPKGKREMFQAINYNDSKSGETIRALIEGGNREVKGYYISDMDEALKALAPKAPAAESKPQPAAAPVP